LTRIEGLKDYRIEGLRGCSASGKDLSTKTRIRGLRGKSLWIEGLKPACWQAGIEGVEE